MSSDLAQAIVNQAKQDLREDLLPKLYRCLELLSDEEIWWRANENTNSVGNLILHLCGNVRQWITSGLGQQPDTRQRDKEFTERGPVPCDELMYRLEETIEEAIEVLDDLQPQTFLNQHSIQVYEVTGVHAILHVLQHFAYHTGQIIYMTRMTKNIDLKFYQL